MSTDLSAIVIHYGDANMTRNVVEQFMKLDSVFSRDCIVVDNASPEGFTAFDYALVLRLSENRGYAAACNAGAKLARGRFFFVLNNDIDMLQNAVTPLIHALQHDSGAGAAGPRLHFPDGRFQLSWGDHPTLRSEFLERRRQRESSIGGGSAFDAREKQSRTAREVDWITGAAMMVKREAWERVGGFDEQYFFYFEDVDFCKRLRLAGWRILYRPEAQLVHVGGASDPMSDPTINAAYRGGQLRYYARFNGATTFFLLKAYLTARCLLGTISGHIDTDTARELLRTMRSTSRSKELHDYRRRA